MGKIKGPALKQRSIEMLNFFLIPNTQVSSAIIFPVAGGIHLPVE